MILVVHPAGAQTTGTLQPVFDDVGIDERLGEQLPMDAVFLDEAGNEVTIGRYFDGERPVILNLVYHNCPMLCSLLLSEFTKTLGRMEWTPGAEFDIITVSFGSGEQPDLAARAKEKYIAQLGNPDAAAGWHFLTGSDESILALADSVGFHFKWMEATKEYAHPAAIMFVSGEGRLTRYIHGMGYPEEDVRRALVEASEGRVGTTVDRILMYCYRYDSTANSYVLHARNLMKLGGLIILLMLVAGLFIFWRRERRNQQLAVA